MDNEILIALGRLEGKMDSLITRQAVHDKTLERHDTRIRNLELSRSWMLGAAAVISVVVSSTINWWNVDVQ